MKRAIGIWLLATCFAVVSSGQVTVTRSRDMASKADSSTEKELMALEHKFDTATKDRDVKTLENLLAADYITTDPSGKISDKAQELNDLANSKGETITSVANTEMVIHVDGTAAVIAGKIRAIGNSSGGPIDVQFRYTNTLVKKSGAWKFIASQQTRIS